MKVKIKKLSPDAVIPTRGTAQSAGLDLTCTRIDYDIYENIVYHTDLAFEIPEGYVGYIFPRSSIAKKQLFLTNSVGVIDSDYRGEVTLKMKRIPIDDDEDSGVFYANINDPLGHYHVGERICQLIIMPYPTIELEEANKLSDTERGNGGYGSTGK